MEYTRIYSDANGDSQFQDVSVALQDKGIIGALSEKFPVRSIQFRENKPNYDWDFHNAPAKQFIILLDGEIEITTSLGISRKFGAGDILLAEDVTGKGHKTKNLVKEIRKSVFIELK